MCTSEEVCDGECACVCVCVCVYICSGWGISSALWSSAISGSLQSPPPYVNKHDRSHCLYQRGGGGGSESGWEPEGSGEQGQRGVHVCMCAGVCMRVWLASQAVSCAGERAREGHAQPCHAGCWPRGRGSGRRRGAGGQGVTRPAGQTEVAVPPAA